MAKTKPKTKPKPKDIDPRWKAIGALIRKDREAKDMGQAELGRMIGLQQASSSMWRYEAGEVSIPIPRLELIAEILGKPASRYIPASNKPAKPALTAEEAREMHHRIARAAMEAAHAGTPEAIEALNDLIAEHHDRTGR